MEGGRGARRLALPSSGCSWAAFEETAKDYGTSGTGAGMPWAMGGGGGACKLCPRAGYWGERGWRVHKV